MPDLEPTFRGPDRGFVYLLKCQEFYKIGIAQNVLERIADMQVGNPLEITLIKSVLVWQPYELEECLHCRQEKHRVGGEWFKLPQDALDEVMTGMDLAVEEQL